ncbi:hypothetical protein BVX98_07720 [bacterium F11]|nr:hypothetical protein BVX98_07720 [bacterium F11]
MYFFFLKFPKLMKLGATLALLVMLTSFLEGKTPDEMALGQWRIGKIILNRHDVFDTGSPLDRVFPYTLANKLHVVTKEYYIRSELLFREGDPYDLFCIQESERILRGSRFFRYVTITPQEPLNGIVDVHIETHDVWTLGILLRYERVGGKNLYGLGILERNLLGTGIQLGGFVRKDIDRTKRGMTFKHRRFLGSPVKIFGGYGKDEKGREIDIRLEKPFWSVQDWHQEGTSVFASDDEGRLFEGGEEVATFQEEHLVVRTEVWFNFHPHERKVRRWGLVHHYDKNEYDNFQSELPLLPPLDHTESVVALGYQFRNDRFIKERGVITFDRDEDFNLGWDWTLEFGPSLEAFGATTDGLYTRGVLRKTWVSKDIAFVMLQMEMRSRYQNDHVEDGIFKVVQHNVLPNWWLGQTFTATLNYKTSRNLDPSKQFLLGGETGLRGYSVRQFSGSKSLLMTLENRKAVLYDWLQMVTVGWGVFFDTGATWKEHQEPSFDEFRSDVGFGIRFAPTRSVRANIIRADLAYALNENERDSRWVFNLTGEFVFGGRSERKFDL